MLDMVQDILPASSDIRKRKKSGTYAVNTMLRKHLDMGLVNTVVPYEKLEEETVQWASEMLEKSPTALRFLKASFNADTDGLAGLQQLAGDATLLYYTTDEAKEGRDAFKEKRNPDFGQFPRFP